MVRLIAAAFAAVTFLSAVTTMAQQLSPREIVVKICEMQLSNSDSKKRLETAQRKANLWKIVDQHFDHQGYVVFVAGPTWKNATPEKRATFSREVYKTLDEIVSAVADVFISECVVEEPKMSDATARVPSRFFEKGDERPQAHHVIFQLELKNGSWKVSDLLVNGSFSARTALAEKHRKTYIALLH